MSHHGSHFIAWPHQLATGTLTTSSGNKCAYTHSIQWMRCALETPSPNVPPYTLQTSYTKHNTCVGFISVGHPYSVSSTRAHHHLSAHIIKPSTVIAHAFFTLQITYFRNSFIHQSICLSMRTHSHSRHPHLGTGAPNSRQKARLATTRSIKLASSTVY